jgi:hypothetical protein
VPAGDAAANAPQAATPPGSPTRFEVYFLAGQSNMEGYGRVSDLPDSLARPDPAVRIFHGNPAPDHDAGGGRGRWSPLRPGHGVGFSTDGTRNAYSGSFGVELTFARRLRELRPGVRIALVKYARGATSLDSLAADDAGSWDPDFRSGQGINQYDHFLATVRNALAATDMDGDGGADELVPAGILWMQGEADGIHAQAAARYHENLTRFVERVRAALGVQDLPVVIGRISDSGRDGDGRVWDYGDLVRSAQAAFVEADAHAALVTDTDGYRYGDPWHYDSAGYLDLGHRFAESMARLRPR